MPIVSIDYSLAPDAPFPRALEEVVYAYAWWVLQFRIPPVYAYICTWVAVVIKKEHMSIVFFS
jgi:hypothetical protein